jgi:hypothetical protein
MHFHIVKMYKDKEVNKNVKNILLSMCDVKVFFDIYFTEFGTALTTILPILFQLVPFVSVLSCKRVKYWCTLYSWLHKVVLYLTSGKLVRYPRTWCVLVHVYCYDEMYYVMLVQRSISFNHRLNLHWLQL